MGGELFCAIPARGGSERLPRKNVLPLFGRPVIAYTIAAALDSGVFDHVYVCTDDPEIAGIAEASGATVPTLVPAKLAGPMISSHESCLWMHDHLGSAANSLVCLQPSSPLRSSSDITRAVDRFLETDPRFLVSVTEIDPHYFHWAVVDDGGWRLFFGEKYMLERQLLPPVFRPNGAIKIGRIGDLKEVGHFFGEPLETISMPVDRSTHVATKTDLITCEALLSNKESRES